MLIPGIKEISQTLGWPSLEVKIKESGKQPGFFFKKKNIKFIAVLLIAWDEKGRMEASPWQEIFEK